MRLKALTLTLAVAVPVVTTGCEQQITGVDPLGEWGGEHVALLVDQNGAQIEYDCAHGSVDEPLEPNSKGVFQATGLHVFEHGGPVRQDEPPDQHPAQYTGTISGRTMTYHVFLIDTEQRLGPFVVTLGEQPRIFKCL